jgi:hypothetical protein
MVSGVHSVSNANAEGSGDNGLVLHNSNSRWSRRQGHRRYNKWCINTRGGLFEHVREAFLFHWCFIKWYKVLHIMCILLVLLPCNGCWILQIPQILKSIHKTASKSSFYALVCHLIKLLTPFIHSTFLISKIPDLRVLLLNCSSVRISALTATRLGERILSIIIIIIIIITRLCLIWTFTFTRYNVYPFGCIY